MEKLSHSRICLAFICIIDANPPFMSVFVISAHISFGDGQIIPPSAEIESAVLKCEIFEMSLDEMITEAFCSNVVGLSTRCVELV